MGGQDLAYIYSFPPEVGREPRVLILGSMPGVESLRKQEYYGHPRNHFWKLIYGIFQRQPHSEYRQRIGFLFSMGIALWDSIAACRREGSVDQNIRDERYNDVVGLLTRYPTIRLIACNGGKSERSFRRGVAVWERHQDLERSAADFCRLPSTSPIPTKKHKSWQDKLSEWAIIADYCR